MVEPRWEVKIGSIVTTTDGDYGHLKQLLLDPHQEQVVGLLVQPRGLLPYHPVVVPERAIADASESEVRLNISREEMEALPKYWSDSPLVVEGEEYKADDTLFAIRGKQKIEVGQAPSLAEPGMIENQLADSESKHFGLRLCAGQLVFCRNEYVGRTSMILLDPNGRVKGFVMHAGHFPLVARERIVPASWIEEVDLENVHLSVEKRDLDNLPEYYSDEELGAAVDNALWSDRILRNTDYQQIGILVEAGVIGLRGHVATGINTRKAEETARSVAGVLGVENDLIADEDLVLEVAQALGKEERTRSERIAVGARNGFITLNGQVGSVTIRDTAEVVAASLPLVRGVINYLHAPNIVINYQDVPTWQPLIRHEISALDMQLGHVERVIINPRNRLVTAFVACGYFPDPADKDGYRLPSDEPHEERSLVIPMDAVSSVTDGSVLLGIKGAEAALYRSFEPADFISPPMSWQPPYPYRWEQVLFDLGRLEE